jgi:hypothetical protein
MASTLKINTLTGVTTAGSIAVTGEGNSTTTNLQQGLAKVWCPMTYDSGTPTATDSFNVSSFSDTQTGDANINYTNSTASVNCSCGGSNISTSSDQGINNKANTTASGRTITRNISNSLVDSDRSFHLFGDLA